MATIGQVIFRIMIVIIILLVAAIALIIGLSVAGNSTTNDVTTVSAVGQIGGNVILSCTFTPDVKQSSNILWEKVGDSGVVYKYENGKISLSDQNPKYKSRTSLFLNELSVGNASLIMNSLTVADSGVYKCTITNSKGKGANTLSLNVGAFSDLTVTSTSDTGLHCDSPRWYPKPTVTWLNVTSASDITNSTSTRYDGGLNGVVEVISDYTGLERYVQYRCVISNNLARAEGDAILTDSGLKTETRLLILSSGQATSPSRLLLCLLILIFHLGAENM
ncbi:V-set domain-containing T-cell activation inhibitor 1 isoform X2 [Phyllobates terribilis]|uniref:V-set domain-containing T-cell activation inhibitor 1 isoform X2 n=1 Tax=Phyllobates terribilis TaxID=111132 RepID=UPI003CCB51E6